MKFYIMNFFFLNPVYINMREIRKQLLTLPNKKYTYIQVL